MTMTFQQLKQNQPELYQKICDCLSCSDYKFFTGGRKPYWDFSFSINCWQFNEFLTPFQWKKFAYLCIQYKADIGEVIQNWTFETSYIEMVNPAANSGEIGNSYIYHYPTNIRGFIGNTYFMIEPDGRSHS